MNYNFIFLLRTSIRICLFNLFTKYWGPYLDMMSHFVVIHLSQAALITSPAYDIGIDEAELKATNLEKLNSL